MKFNAVATTVSAALLAGAARAEEPEAQASIPELPTFTVSTFLPPPQQPPING